MSNYGVCDITRLIAISVSGETRLTKKTSMSTACVPHASRSIIGDESSALRLVGRVDLMKTLVRCEKISDSIVKLIEDCKSCFRSQSCQLPLKFFRGDREGNREEKFGNWGNFSSEINCKIQCDSSEWEQV